MFSDSKAVFVQGGKFPTPLLSASDYKIISLATFSQLIVEQQVVTIYSHSTRMHNSLD